MFEKVWCLTQTPLFFELNSKSHLSEEGCLINGILGILCLVNKSGDAQSRKYTSPNN